ncbi:hypothetical protein HK102_013166 [Quaeritorhiza haematococci]|nr:hypothetical protein HK102_013166 [Quaeritorhiza haematococci]
MPVEWAAMIAIIGTINLLTALINTGIGISKQLPYQHNYYTLRLEAGIGAGADGHPPKITLTDYGGQQFKGYVVGNAGQRCGLFKKGLGLGEAPMLRVQTVNGFNLKKVNVYPGSNGVCVSNVIVKGGDSAREHKQIFVPVGDILAFCGHPWNWGAKINGIDQRCVWLGKAPTESGVDPLGILSLDISHLSGIFDSGSKPEILMTTKVEDVCKYIKDISKGPTAEPSTHRCRNSKSRPPTIPSETELFQNPRTLDTIPLVDITSETFQTQLAQNPNFVGGPFMTLDNLVYVPQKKTFVKPGSTEQSIQTNKLNKRRTDQVIKVQSCSRSNDPNNDQVVCTVVREILLPEEYIQDEQL